MQLIRLVASQFSSPHPNSLSQNGRGSWNLVPLLPKREKGLGNEGWKIETLSFLYGIRYLNLI